MCRRTGRETRSPVSRPTRGHAPRFGAATRTVELARRPSTPRSTRAHSHDEGRTDRSHCPERSQQRPSAGSHQEGDRQGPRPRVRGAVWLLRPLASHSFAKTRASRTQSSGPSRRSSARVGAASTHGRSSPWISRPARPWTSSPASSSSASSTRQRPQRDQAGQAQAQEEGRADQQQAQGPDGGARPATQARSRQARAHAQAGKPAAAGSRWPQARDPRRRRARAAQQPSPCSPTRRCARSRDVVAATSELEDTGFERSLGMPARS